MQTATINNVDADRDVSTDVADMPDELGKEEQKSRFILLRAKGYSYARISKELGVSKGTLVNWNAEMEAEISRARSVELEALQEEYYLLKEGRIRLLGEQLKTIQTEIGKRDLSKIKTDKLIELQLRYFGELKIEYVKTGQRTQISPKLNSRDIGEQLEMVLIRYRAGEIDEAQAKLEQTILQSMLKAIEQTELATKLERLEAIVQSRR
ncbi:helix-turn-helix domain-containing protein [Planctomycetota bacterium]